MSSARHLLGGLFLAMTLASTAAAAPIALVITYQSTPAQILSLRKAVREDLAPRLARAFAGKRLSGFSLFLNRDVDAVTWSAMAVLDFASEPDLEAFEHAEGPAAALSPRVLSASLRVETAECAGVRGAQGTPAANPLYLILPYHLAVSNRAYLAYLDGYTDPQLDGWLKAGVLSGYRVLLTKFGAGRPWAAMLVLRYRDAASLARRDLIKSAVRQRLDHRPLWHHYSVSKLHIRDELAGMVAEKIAGAQSTP